MNGPSIFSVNQRFAAPGRDSDYAGADGHGEPDTARSTMAVAASGNAACAEVGWRTLSAPEAALAAVQAGAVSAAQTADVARATLVLAAAGAAHAVSSGNLAPAHVAADTAAGTVNVGSVYGVISEAVKSAAAAAGHGASANAAQAGLSSSSPHAERTQKESSAPAQPRPAARRPPGASEADVEDFGEILRHELNNPLTGILGNAELLLAEIRRSEDGRVPRGGVQRLETIATLAVRLRETIRRISQEWLVEGSVARKKSDW